MLFEKIWIYFVFLICFGFLGVTIGLVNIFEENPMVLIFSLSWVLILCFLTRLCNIFDHFRPDFLVISVLLSLTFIVLVVDHRDLDGKGGDSLLFPAHGSSDSSLHQNSNMDKFRAIDQKHRLIHFYGKDDIGHSPDRNKRDVDELEEEEVKENVEDGVVISSDNHHYNSPTSLHIHYGEFTKTVGSLFSTNQAFSTTTGTLFLCLFFLFVILSFSFLVHSITWCFWKTSFIKLPFNSKSVINRIFTFGYDWSRLSIILDRKHEYKEKPYKRDIVAHERNCKSLIRFFSNTNIMESSSSEITNETDIYEPVTAYLEPFRSVTKTDPNSQNSLDAFFGTNGFVNIESLLSKKEVLSDDISKILEAQTSLTPRNIKRSLRLYNVNLSVLGTEIVKFYAQKSVTDVNWVFKQIPREILVDLPEYKKLAPNSDILSVFFTANHGKNNSGSNHPDGISGKIPSKVTQRIIDITVHDSLNSDSTVSGAQTHSKPKNRFIKNTNVTSNLVTNSLTKTPKRENKEFSQSFTNNNNNTKNNHKMDDNMLAFVKFSLSNMYLWDALNPLGFLTRITSKHDNLQDFGSLSNIMVIVHFLSRTNGGSSKLSKTSDILLDAIKKHRLGSVLETKIIENNNKEDTTSPVCCDTKSSYKRIWNWMFFGLFIMFLVGFCCLSPEKTIPWDLAHPMNWFSLLIRLICIFTLWVVYIFFYYFRELNRTSSLICIYYKCKLLLLKLTIFDIYNSVLERTNVKTRSPSPGSKHSNNGPRNNNNHGHDRTMNGDGLEPDKVPFLQIPKHVLSKISENKISASSSLHGSQVINNTNNNNPLVDPPLNINNQVAWGRRNIYFNGLCDVVTSPSLSDGSSGSIKPRENKKDNVIHIPGVFQLDMLVRIWEPFIHDMEDSLNGSFVKALNSVYSGYFDYFSHVKSSEFITELPLFMILIFVPSLTLVLMIFILELFILCLLVLVELSVWISFKDVPKILDKYLLRTNSPTVGFEESQNQEEEEDKEIHTLVNMLGLVSRKPTEKKFSSSNNNHNKLQLQQPNHVSLNIVSDTPGMGEFPENSGNGGDNNSNNNNKQKSLSTNKDKKRPKKMVVPKTQSGKSMERKQKKSRKYSTDSPHTSRSFTRYVTDDGSDDSDDNNGEVSLFSQSDNIGEYKEVDDMDQGYVNEDEDEDFPEKEESNNVVQSNQNIFDDDDDGTDVAT